jgi:hypothetical protein
VAGVGALAAAVQVDAEATDGGSCGALRTPGNLPACEVLCAAILRTVCLPRTFVVRNFALPHKLFVSNIKSSKPGSRWSWTPKRPPQLVSGCWHPGRREMGAARRSMLRSDASAFEGFQVASSRRLRIVATFPK